MCFSPHVASGAESDPTGVYFAQHILGCITDDLLAWADGAPMDVPGLGPVVVHPHFMGTLGDLVGQRDVFCVKRNACALCVRVSDALPSVVRTAAHRAHVLEEPPGTADRWGYLDWVAARDVRNFTGTPHPCIPAMLMVHWR